MPRRTRTLVEDDGGWRLRCLALAGPAAAVGRRQDHNPARHCGKPSRLPAAGKPMRGLGLPDHAPHGPAVSGQRRVERGQCGLARPRVLAGESPAWVIVSREPSIEPCGAGGNSRVDA